MANYTCYVNQTIMVGVNSEADQYNCTGFDETPISWTAPSTPGLYNVSVPRTTYKLVYIPGPKPDTWDGTYVCRSSNTYQVYTVQVNAAFPTITSTTGMQACPGQTFTIKGNYFGPNAQANIVSPATYLPITSAPTSTDGGVTWTMVVRLPSTFSSTAGSYQVTVTDGAGNVSAPAPFNVPTGCAATQSGITLTVSSSLNPCTTNDTVTLKAVNQNGTDVTNQTVFSGSGVSGTTFHSLTAGTYPIFGTYSGVTASFSQVVNQAVNPNQQTLAGYAVPSFFVPLSQTPMCNIIVTSQINIYLGDGRQGFVLADPNTTITLAPGQAWIAKFTEVVDANMVPLLPGNSQITVLASQNVPTFSHYVESIDDASVFYNVGSLVNNNDGTYTRDYSVLLGICDPVNGKFQSMWDIFSYNGVDNDMLPQPPCGHGMFLSAKGDISIEDYAKKKLKNHRPTEVAPNTERAAAIWTGSVQYETGKLTINEPLKLLMLDAETNVYGIAYVSDSKSIKMKKESLLIAVPTAAGSFEIQTISVNDKLFDSSHTFVLGVLTAETFHSNWPFLTVHSHSSSTKKVMMPSDLSPTMRQIVERMKENK